MRIPIKHDLSQDEVRHRLRSRSHEIGDLVPGGMADVTTGWPSEDRMELTVRAMGQDVTGHVDIEPGQVVFEIDLPAALSFVKPMISSAIKKEGQKLLT